MTVGSSPAALDVELLTDTLRVALGNWDCRLACGGSPIWLWLRTSSLGYEEAGVEVSVGLPSEGAGVSTIVGLVLFLPKVPTTPSFTLLYALLTEKGLVFFGAATLGLTMASSCLLRVFRKLYEG